MPTGGRWSGRFRRPCVPSPSKIAACPWASLHTVPPPTSDSPPPLLQVYDGMDPMEEANRLSREGALDYLQYRWVGAVLCRGAGRLKRPVVWSTFVRIDGGPK